MKPAAIVCADNSVGRQRAVVIGLMTAVLFAAAGWADATRCIYPLLPRPDQPAEEIRAELEADGLWRPNRTDERTPPADPQVGDTWLWYIWDLGGQ